MLLFGEVSFLGGVAVMLLAAGVAAAYPVVM